MPLKKSFKIENTFFLKIKGAKIQNLIERTNIYLYMYLKKNSGIGIKIQCDGKEQETDKHPIKLVQKVQSLRKFPENEDIRLDKIIQK